MNPDDRIFPQIRSDHLNHWRALGPGNLALLASSDALVAARPKPSKSGIVGWNRSPRHSLLYATCLERIAFLRAPGKQGPRSILWTRLYGDLSARHGSRLAEIASLPLGCHLGL